MFIKEICPNIALAGFIRKYQVIRWQYDPNCLPVDKFLAPRPEHSLTFYLRDSQSYRFIDSQVIKTYPKSIVCGIHDTTIIRNCGYDFWALKIIFTPSALYRLTDIPIREFVSSFVDAEIVFGKEISMLYERLNGLNDLDQMVAQIELYLHKLILKSIKSWHPVDKVCLDLIYQNLPPSLDELAKKAFLCTRQFIRKFEQRTGVSPKLFDRIVRFDKAYRLKNNQPDMDWLAVAIDSGHYDYQHLAKDYKDFTGESPVSYYEIDKKAPERSFGLHFG